MLTEKETKEKEPDKKEQPEPEKKKKASSGNLIVTPDDVNARDGAYYILHTLVGARNAGMMNLGKDIRVGADGGSITVVSTGDGKGAVKRGSVGRGGVKKDLKQAEMLSVSEPKKLMKSLGVASPAPASEANDLDKVLFILRQALYGNPTMRKAFTGVRKL